MGDSSNLVQAALDGSEFEKRMSKVRTLYAERLMEQTEGLFMDKDLAEVPPKVYTGPKWKTVQDQTPRPNHVNAQCTKPEHWDTLWAEHALQGTEPGSPLQPDARLVEVKIVHKLEPGDCFVLAKFPAYWVDAQSKYLKEIACICVETTFRDIDEARKRGLGYRQKTICKDVRGREVILKDVNEVTIVGQDCFLEQERMFETMRNSENDLAWVDDETTLTIYRIGVWLPMTHHDIAHAMVHGTLVDKVNEHRRGCSKAHESLHVLEMAKWLQRHSYEGKEMADTAEAIVNKNPPVYSEAVRGMVDQQGNYEAPPVWMD